MWFEVVVGAVMLGSYIYHRWIEDHPAQLTPQVSVPRTSEGTSLPIVYGQCRIRSPVAVWAGNYLAPGTFVTPWNRAPFEHDFTSSFYSVDVLFCLGIPFYSTAVAGVTFPSTLRGAWAGDTPMAMTINGVAGTSVQACYSGPTTLSAGDVEQGKFTFTGLYYPGTWDQSVLDGSTAFGTTPATIPDTTVFAPFPEEADQTHGFWPDGHYYDYTAAGTSAFAAFKQANADINMPGCRGQAMLFAHVSLGQSPSLPAFQFEVRSTQTGSAVDLGNAFAFDSSTADADPAAVILDLLTSPWGKAGLSISQVYLPSFQAASDTLFAEQHGYSRAFEQPADADAMINDVIAQIDAAWYQEPTTGQVVIKLIRFDYDPNALDDINPDNAEPTGPGWYTVQGWAEVPNQVRVTFRDRSDNYVEAVATAQDPSLIESNGGRLRSVNVRYEGCCVREIADRLAARELAAVGRPMVRATVMVDRSFHAKRPGDVVTLTWPHLNINKMVMRIAAIDLGVPQSGKIKVSLMRDIFDVQVGAF